MSNVLQPLNLPPYPFKLREVGGGHQIYDDIRQKWLLCTPEEWIRQHFVKFLEVELGYPRGLIALEIGLPNGAKMQRADIVVYGKNQQPLVIVECKSPQVPLSTTTFEQAARYNAVLKVPILMVTNGLEHYCAQVDLVNASWKFLAEFPRYESLM
ncbi:MAG: type I restriction enzyme HsdR N-terminal domain-containing protein [Flavobacteriales bacterium]|nr:type I restriction enzyme HsdR N-terminal domain-containing protein [Flavobacteriales bacterium]